MGLKVLYVITGLERGGAENALLRLLKKIDRKKYSPAIASLVGGDLEAEFRKLAKVTILNAKKITDALRAVKKIRTIIKNEKIDIVHSYLYHANIIARLAAVGTKAKVISSIRIKEIKKRSHNCADRLTQRLVTHYTAVSESVKKFMIAYGIPESKITTIPNGIDLEEFKIKISKTEKRKSLGIPERAPIIISVANLRKTKDYPTLFEALAQVRKKHKAELLVVGRGEAEKEYRKKAEQEGVMSATRFLGYRPDVKELIAISDVCVLSTHYEGQSNALLEYMALKKPIVATNIEENREIITNGKEGILVPEERPDLLAQAITLLLEDKKLAKRLGSAAFERVKKDHNIEKTALKTQELYDSICQRRK